ncbi:MAG: aminoacyl-tRNA hydrolase [Desulfovibrio sp.]|uniref:aminoacyl-tRNA hydrolase n=1 Tax=Desulfovibrio sp. 7SRBS1 TaxID=3378064 RepID=UPI003B3E1DE5
MSDAGLIVGLGNPGSTYAKNRHNIGFMAVDSILAEIEAKPYRRCSLLAENDDYILWRISLPRVRGDFLLTKPFTYMNLSGRAVLRICMEYGIKPSGLAVMHDEMDLTLGRIKLKRGGGDAGHNGIASIAQELGTPDFFRVRMGIGRPERSSMVKDYVLTDFPQEQADIVAKVADMARDCLPTLFGRGLSAAQQAVHPLDAAAE